MLALNGIPCGSYTSKENEVRFSLDTNDLSSVSDISGDLTVTDGDKTVDVFCGYTVMELKRVGKSILLIASRNLPEDSSEAIRALEINMDNLKKEMGNDISTISYEISDTQSVLPSLIMRANLSDEEALSCEKYYPYWKVDCDYKKDWIVRYEDSLYRIGQDHTSQEQWVPGETGTEALYSKIEIEGEYEIWKAWDGVSGSYALGQIVKDPNDENLYKSKIDSNVWGPPSEQPDYWELYTED